MPEVPGSVGYVGIAERQRLTSTLLLTLQGSARAAQIVTIVSSEWFGFLKYAVAGVRLSRARLRH